MRQQLTDSAVRVRGQSREYIAQVGMRIVAVGFGGLDQGHDVGGALARGF